MDRPYLPEIIGRSESVLLVGENLEFFAQLTAETTVDCTLRPLEQICVPCGAVIQGDCGNAAHGVYSWPEAICQIGRQALSLRIFASAAIRVTEI